MKYPKAGDLQRALGVELTENPSAWGDPTQNPYEVRSASGLEGVFANEDDAEFHASELRREGVGGVSVGRRKKATRPMAAPRYRVQQNPSPGRLFAGVYPTGIVYADREREIDGDYMRVAFLPYSTLELQWAPGQHPRELRDEVELDAARLQSMRGQEFQVSTSGQTITLGKRNPADLTAKGERMYKHVVESYGDDPRAKEIASRTVSTRARSTPGLKRRR